MLEELIKISFLFMKSHIKILIYDCAYFLITHTDFRERRIGLDKRQILKYLNAFNTCTS